MKFLASTSKIGCRFGVLGLKLQKALNHLIPHPEITCTFPEFWPFFKNPTRVDPFIKPNKTIETVILVTF